MPRPVPPPPPQPSAEETVRAVRYLRVVVVVGLLFFFGWSQLAYGPDSFIQAWGRDSSQSWMVHKARTLDPTTLRAHEGGDIVWLVGSSILRESVDIPAINEALASRGSRYRAQMFCQGRGAAGLASGMVAQLPIRSGDLLVHNVAVQNLRADWLSWTGLPPARMSRMLSPAQLWDTRELPLPDRLEQLVAVPWNFWRWHDDTQAGLERWLEALASGRTARKRRPHIFFRHSNRERASIYDHGPPDWEVDQNLLTTDTIDFSPRQFNVQGLERLRSWSTQHDVELVLLDIPPSAFAQWRLETAGVRAEWAAWRDAQPDLAFAPQLPDNAYYDRRHPNFRGRAALSAWLVDWLEAGHPRGTRTVTPESAVELYPWSDAPGPADADDLETL